MPESKAAIPPLGIEDILGQIKPPERVYRLCLRSDLRAEWEDLDRRVRIAEREAASSLAGTSKAATELAKKCRAVEEQMEAATVPLQLRGITTRAYSDLLVLHPPRKGKSEEMFNAETFGPALLAASVVAPAMSADQAGQLVDRLTNGQWTDLFNTCWQLNQGSVDVPKSRSASEILHATKTS